MPTVDVITREQIEKTLAWIEASFASAETMIARQWITTYFYPDAAIAFNDESPTKGHEVMISYMDYFHSTLSSIKHIIERVDVLSDRVYIQVHVEFIVKNDPEQKTITFEGIVVAEKKIDEDMVSFYKIYADKARLEQRIKMFH
jgi:hypothetical protein